MEAGSRTATAHTARYLRDRVRSWRTGSRESQLYVLTVLLAAVTICFLVSWWAYSWMPLTAYFVWLLVGMLLLRFVPLAILAAYDVAAGIASLVLQGSMTATRWVAVVNLLVAAALVVYQASRQRSGLPGPLSEAMLADLRDRLQAQGKVPELPEGWRSQSAMIASNGVRYAGDFLVADLSPDRRRLEIVLVDVVGKGHDRRARSAAVRRRPRRAAGSPVPAGAVPRGQRLPAATGLRGGVRDRRSPVGGP